MKKIIILAFPIVIFSAGFYLLQTKTTTVPTRTEITPTIVARNEPTEDQIIKALSVKNNWEESNVEVSISTIEGEFAKGSVNIKGEMGGGMWFAAKVGGEWRIVYDGNGIITCDLLTDYQGFPKDLIPSCYDQQTEKLITR